MEREIKVYNEWNEALLEVANLLVQNVQAAKDTGRKYHLAVSGGTTPRLLFDLLASNAFKHNIDWQHVQIFWVDERCVAPTHPESNYGMTYKALLSKVNIPTNNIFRMRGEEDPETEALRYTTLLKQHLPFIQAFPVFDLILLGMGDDGHTASIFPDNMTLMFDRHLLVGTTIHPLSGQRRITLTGNTINHARDIVFLIAGAAKAKVVSDILSNQTNASLYPASYVGTKELKVRYFLDKEAASLL